MEGFSGEPEGETAVPLPPRSHARWMVIAVVVVVVLATLGAAGLFGGLFQPASNPSPGGHHVAPPPGGAPGPGLVILTSMNFTGRNVDVGAVTIIGPDRVAAGTEANLSVPVTPTCGVDGCVGKVVNIQLSNGFSLRSSSPGLPASFNHTETEVFTLTVGVPSLAGSYNVPGLVIGSAPPGPVTVGGMNWSVTYQGNGSDYLQVAGVPPPVHVVPNASFSVELSVTSNDSYPVNLETLGVQSPFVLASTNPVLPLQMGPNATLNVTVELRAPAPGNYSIHGSVAAKLAPVVIVASIGYELIFDPDPFYQVQPNFTAPPAYLQLGGQIVFKMYIFNGDTVTHNYQVNGVLGPWVLGVVSPKGNIAVGADSTGVWILTVTAPTAPGTYDLTVVVENTN